MLRHAVAQIGLCCPRLILEHRDDLDLASERGLEDTGGSSPSGN